MSDEKTTSSGEKLTAVGKVASLHFYPVKSTGRMDVNSFKCSNIGPYLEEHGIYDRFFMVIKGSGHMATIREFHRMVLIKPSVSNGKLHLDAPDMSTLSVPIKLEKTDSSVIHKVDCYGQNTYGIDCGQEASDWLSKFIGKPNCKLLYFTSEMQKRPACGGFFGEVGIKVPEDSQLAYSDAAPFMVMSEASVELLNTHLKKPVSAHNFRPNIIVKGTQANEEDSWDTVQIGDAIFKCATHDPRCILTTIDPVTGIKDPDMEPLRTLRKVRPIAKFDEKSPMLGMYMVMEQAGEIKVGDTIYASKKSPDWK